ncbi:MAG: hypothetical protein NTW19_18745 [Planctomycetota bacterium]|nr:hypothetical protein [Planctomycetota bacterium]
MTTRWQKLVHLLVSARLELVFPAVANNWLVIFLADRLETSESTNPALATMSRASAMGLSAAIAVGLGIYALALNDIMDLRHDRAFRPNRPLAAGRVGLPTAVLVAFLCLLGAVGASVFLGRDSVLLCLVAAGATLFYNAVGKFFPAVGVTTLALIWALGMAIPNPQLVFAWPVWLTFTHVMGCTLAVHVLEGKRPRLRGPEWLGVCGSWTFWTLVLVLWMNTRSGDLGPPGAGRPGLWGGPLLAVGGFLVAGWFSVHDRMRPLRSRRAAGDDLRTLAIVWLIAFNAGWLLSAGAIGPGLFMLALFGLAVASRRLGSALEEWALPSPSFQVGVPGAAPDPSRTV